jgi:hypothetical protein
MMTQVSLRSNVIESNVLNMPHMRKNLELELTSANDRNAIVSMIQFFFLANRLGKSWTHHLCVGLVIFNRI